MPRVFADTFFFLAVLNRRDPAHEEALQYYGDTSVAPSESADRNAALLAPASAAFCPRSDG